MILAVALVLVAAVVIVVTLGVAITWGTAPGVLEERLGLNPTMIGRELSETELAQPFGARVIAPMGTAVAGFVAERTQQHRLDSINKQLRLAGSRLSAGAFLTFTLVSAVVASVAGLLVFRALGVKSLAVGLVLSLLFFILGYIAPRTWLSRRTRARQARIRNSLPNALDILATCVSAGQAVQAALSKLAQRLQDDLGAELRVVNDQVQLGYPLGDALNSLAERCNIPELTRFTMAVSQAMQIGAPMAEFLTAQADDLRRQRRQRAEERAQTAPLRMLPPMIGCVFPAIFVVLLGPALIDALRAFSH